MTLGVYIQVPFCQTKCTYCNFHTGVVSRDRYKPYADAICREISDSSTPANFAKDFVAAAFRPANFASPTEVTSSSIPLGGRSFSSAILRSGEHGALAPEAPAAIVDTVYFGGGTPSLLEPSALGTILNTLRQNFLFASKLPGSMNTTTCHSERSEESAFSSPEVTLEADPETITLEKSAAWLASGFNRISLGAQSFNDRELQATG